VSGEAELRDLFVAALAREMRDGERVFLGANQGEAALAAYLARSLWAPRLKLWTAGMAQIDPAQDRLFAGRRTYENVLVAARGSSFWQARGFDDALRAPVVFAGGIQVDERGNANLAGLRDQDGGWKLRGPGSAGLPSLTAFAKRFFIMVTSHDPRSLVERVSAISVLGDPVARAELGLERDALVSVITPLATFVPSDDGLVLREVAGGVGADELKQRTGFPIRAHEAVTERRPLSDEEARSLASLRAAAAANGSP
jgi:glutaconate CoA-transferase, subunit B